MIEYYANVKMVLKNYMFNMKKKKSTTYYVKTNY